MDCTIKKDNFKIPCRIQKSTEMRKRWIKVKKKQIKWSDFIYWADVDFGVEIFLEKCTHFNIGLFDCILAKSRFIVQAQTFI